MKKIASVPKSAKPKPAESLTKKSVIEYRSDKDITSLFGALAETERSISDMTRVFAELPASNQRGVGGEEKLTTRQQEVLNIIAQSQHRADQIVSLIREKHGN